MSCNRKAVRDAPDTTKASRAEARPRWKQLLAQLRQQRPAEHDAEENYGVQRPENNLTVGLNP